MQERGSVLINAQRHWQVAQIYHQSAKSKLAGILDRRLPSFQYPCLRRLQIQARKLKTIPLIPRIITQMVALFPMPKKVGGDNHLTTKVKVDGGVRDLAPSHE